MQASSLLLLPGPAIHPLDLSALSDQALMEEFIGKLKVGSKAEFISPDGSYKDTCKWRGVRCNGRRQVIEIDMNEDAKSGKLLIGKLSFLNLPPTLLNIDVVNHDFRDMKLMGSLDTRALPPKLMKFFLRGVILNSNADLRWLPPDIWFFGVMAGAVSGTCCLTALPQKMKTLFMTNNSLHGGIVLDHLPQKLEVLDLVRNRLSGTINLRNLPKNIVTLGLSDNRFSGEIDVNHLPHNVVEIDLSKNALSGTLRCFSLPASLETLDVRKNMFLRTAVIARCVLPAVSADFVKMKCIDGNGTQYTSKEIAMHMQMRRKREH